MMGAAGMKRCRTCSPSRDGLGGTPSARRACVAQEGGARSTPKPLAHAMGTRAGARRRLGLVRKPRRERIYRDIRSLPDAAVAKWMVMQQLPYFAMMSVLQNRSVVRARGGAPGLESSRLRQR